MYQSCRSVDEQVTVFNIVFAVYTGMFGVGIITAGFTADFFRGGWLRYRLVLAISAAILLVEALLRGLMLSCDIPKQSKAKRKRTSVLKDSRLFIFLVLPLIQGVAMNFSPPYNNLIVKYRCNWEDSTISILLAATSFSLLLFSLITPEVMKRLKMRTGFAMAYMSNVVVTFILGFPLPNWIFIILFVLRGGCSIMVNNMLDSRIFATLHDGQRDFFAGARSLLRSVGGAVAAYLTGVLLQKGNSFSPFLLTSIAFIASAVWFFVIAEPKLEYGRSAYARFDSYPRIH
jgi:predicted MFS family arabinose efflux permease